MNKPKLLWLIACIGASAGSAIAQGDLLSRPAGGVVAPGLALPLRRPVHPAVVRVVAPGKGSTSYGSGSLVAVNERHGLVITNWHVINEATRQITVEFPDGFESAATVQKFDRDWDLAALVIWKPSVTPVSVARQAPQPGEMLTIAGYGPGKYRAASGRCTQYVAPNMKFPYEMVELAAAARQGDSGGPIFNSRGELAGVLFAEGEGRTLGSYCGRVQWFLDSVIGPQAPRIPADSAVAQAAPLPAIGSIAAAGGSARPSAGSAATPKVGTALESLRDTAAPWRPVGEAAPQVAHRSAQAADSLLRDAEQHLPLSDGEGAASVVRPIPIAATGEQQADSDSVSTRANSDDGDRLGQIKDFMGVIACVGFVLFLVRRLASNDRATDGKTPTDRAT